MFDHVWQSTLFAAIAAGLACMLRRNRAAVRYWVWMAASLKFLLPFSLLVALGVHFPWRTASTVKAPSVALAIEQTVTPVVTAPVRIAPHRDLLPAIEFIWACGSLAVLTQWFVRWRRVRALARSASPADLDFPVPARSSCSLVEPGVFGVIRPVLLLPAGITDRLTTDQVRAILMHEASHIRRRDNLTAFLHMLVEAVFWFHPFVWWIGARLVDERERACDEEVLRCGGAPQAYVEGILAICKRYVVAPSCVAGVTGSNLKKRIVEIMSGRAIQSLCAAKRAAIAAAGIIAIAVPIAFGILRAQSADWESAAGGKMAFDAASVKLDTGPFRPPAYPLDSGNAYKPSAQFSADFPLLIYIEFAYKTQFWPQQRDAMLAHLPKWIQQDRYAIEARSTNIPTKDQVRLMLQSLLAERFGLEVHFVDQETAVFAMTLLKPGKPGPSLKPHSEGPPCDEPADGRNISTKTEPDVFPARCEVQAAIMRPGQLVLAGGRNTTMDEVAWALLFGRLDRPVVDQTGITGRIDYRIEFVRSPNPAAPPDANAEPTPGPTFMDAVHDQLGLKLEPTRASLRVLTIDHVDRPTPN